MSQIKLNRLKKHRLMRLHKDVISLISGRVWLCGGALRSLLDGMKPNDYDLFFKDAEAAVETELKLDAMGYQKIFVCPLGELTTFSKRNVKIQVIKKTYYQSIEHCIDTFDFNAACAGIDTETFYFVKKFISDNRKKAISIHRLTYPTATISRLHKYKNYGFYVSEAIRDVVLRISENDPDIIDLGALYVD
jgi:hypothetical protein